ncbi:winged helix domain-containing protein [Asticcacaulis solisilvae]|uniref:winged helix domain-containing protein n=1 Tax=Asticcacaulis solisilvae TaxID=1217274 RepID=UPI003FD7B3CD
METIQGRLRLLKSPLRVLLDGGEEIHLTGMEACTYRLLDECKERGLTQGEANPPGLAFRWPVYISGLRGKGIGIETLWERTPSGARIGRYILRCNLKFVSV